MAEEQKANLDEAINAAFAQAPQSESESELDESQDGDAEDSQDVDGEIPDEDEDEDEEASQDSLSAREAQNIYELLKNPATAKDTLRQLGEYMGMKFIEDNPSATKTEIKENAKAVRLSVEQILQTELGDDYALLGRNFSGAIEKVIKEIVEETVNPIKADIDAHAKREMENAGKRAYKRAQNLPNFAKNVVKFQAVMGEIPFSGDPTEESYFKYLRRINTILNDENSSDQKIPADLQERTRERVRRNQGMDIKTNGATQEPRSVKRPTMDQAIKMALAKANRT